MRTKRELRDERHKAKRRAARQARKVAIEMTFDIRQQVEVAKSIWRSDAPCGRDAMRLLEEAVTCLGGRPFSERDDLVRLVRDWPDSGWMHLSIEDGNLDEANLFEDINDAFLQAEAFYRDPWLAAKAGDEPTWGAYGADRLRDSLKVALAFLRIDDEDERYRLWCEATRYPYRDEDGRLYSIESGQMTLIEEAA